MSGTPPRTVYVVTTGSFSDYHIEAVLLERDAAERYLAELNKGRTYQDGEIEEWPVTEQVGTRVAVHCVTLTAKGELREWTLYEWERDAPRRPDAAPYFNGGVFVRCTDPGLARKAAHDRIAQLRAEREGLA